MAKRIIAVINQKGGVGKTTSVVNIAAGLASTNKRVLVCDLDPQGNATSGLGIDKQQLSSTLYDVLFSRAEAMTVIQPLRIKNLFVLPSNSQLAAAEVELVPIESREFVLKRILEPLPFDYILIDCPPSLGLLTINALTAADDVIIPLQTEYYALEGLGQLLDVMQMVRQNINPSLELLGVLLTMYDRRNSLSEQVKYEAERHFGDKLLRTTIPRNVRLAEAPSFGKTIYEHDKWSKGSRAYKALVKELEKRLG